MLRNTDRKNTDIIEKISVTCPHCGEVTEFLYEDSLPTAALLHCRKCKEDIRRAYLQALLAVQKKQQNKTSKKLLIFLFLNLTAAIFLLIYVFSGKPGQAIAIFLFCLNLLILTILLHFYRKNRVSINKIEDLRRKFHL